MKTLESYITESLYNHLNIEYGVFENAGLYDGIEDLCKFLTNKIKSRQDKEFVLTYNIDDRELSKLKNVFFDNIVLDCERSNKYTNEAEYVTNKMVDFDKNTNRLKSIYINVYLSQKHDSREVYLILLHELTHAWDNYNHIKRYNQSLNDDKKYVDRYNSIIKSLDNNTLIGKILYFINPGEVNAWMASFAGYLYDNVKDNTIDDPHKALEIIKGSDLYKNYVNIGIWVDAIYNKSKNITPQFMHDLCEEYNRIYGTNFTEDKVRKQLYNQYHKVRNKIESNIGKICTKYIKTFVLR